MTALGLSLDQTKLAELEACAAKILTTLDEPEQEEIVATLMLKFDELASTFESDDGLHPSESEGGFAQIPVDHDKLFAALREHMIASDPTRWDATLE